VFAMEEDDGVICFEKFLARDGAAGAGGEVVDESDCVPL